MKYVTFFLRLLRLLIVIIVVDDGCILRIFGLLLFGMDIKSEVIDDVVMVEECLINRDRNETLRVSLADTGEEASADFKTVEASVSLTAEDPDTQIDSVIEEDEACADSDKDNNEDTNGRGCVVVFSISSSITIYLQIMESLLDLGVITGVELIDALGVGRRVVR